MYHSTTTYAGYRARRDNEIIYAELYPLTHPHIGCSIHGKYIECIRLDSRIVRPIADHETDWEYRVVVQSHNGDPWIRKTLVLPTSSHVTMFLLKYAGMIEMALVEYGFIPTSELYDKFGITTPSMQ